MRILICTGIYPPDVGGPATYSKLLFDELPKRGFTVEILSFGEVRHLPKILRHFVYFLKVLKLGRKSQIIFAQDPVSVGLPSALAAKCLGKKFILKIVGDYAWEQYQNQKSKTKNQKFITLEEFQEQKFDFLTELRRKTQKYVAGQAKVIIVPSGYLKNIVSKWGIKPEKISVIYNAFDAPEVKISKGEARKKFGLAGTVLISAGRLVSWKGFDALVDLIPELIKEIPDVRLVIIGDGSEKEALKIQITKSKLQKNVFLTGVLPRGEVLNYLRAGDVFILNTGYEGFSHQILEAMAMEIPIITTNVGGNPEIIEDKDSGFLVKYNSKEQLADAILFLYKNAETRSAFIRKAKEKITFFGKDRMIEETIKILNS